MCTNYSENFMILICSSQTPKQMIKNNLLKLAILRFINWSDLNHGKYN